MRKLLVVAGITGAAFALSPGTSGAEFSYLVAQVSSSKLKLTFNDGNACGLHVSVARDSKTTARSNARYYCFNEQTGEPLKKPIKVKIVNAAGQWLTPRIGQNSKTYTYCEGHECHAQQAITHDLDGGKATGNAVFHIYYGRNPAFFFPPPGCEFVEDPEGKGPPGHRVTCAIQVR